MYTVVAFFLILLSPILLPLGAAGFHLIGDLISGERR
jgi:hypothetical protein